MLQVSPGSLSIRSHGYLKAWQKVINRKRIFENKVKFAKELWPQKNGLVTLQEIKSLLKAASGPLECCQYCGRPEGTQLDHIWPKVWFPEKTFAWNNLLLACDKCNNHKRDNFRLDTSTGPFSLATLPPKSPRTRPPKGQSVMLDPRSEDPFPFLVLDLNTGVLQPRDLPGTPAYIRAEYTIDLLWLNKRPGLIPFELFNATILGIRSSERDYESQYSNRHPRKRRGAQTIAQTAA